MSGDGLGWEHPRTGKRFGVGLAEVTHVLPGKQTPNFRKEESVTAVAEKCFSLETISTTVDIETKSKENRDVLVVLFKQACINASTQPSSQALYKTFGNDTPNPLQRKGDEESGDAASLLPSTTAGDGRPELTGEGELDNDDPTSRVNSILFKGILLHTGRGPQQVGLLKSYKHNSLLFKSVCFIGCLFVLGEHEFGGE